MVITSQHISAKQKNKEFIKNTLNDLFYIAVSQINENRAIVKLDRLISGGYTYKDYKDSAYIKGYLDLVRDTANDEDIQKIEHFDFLGNIVHHLVGTFFKRTLKVNIDYVGNDATSTYLREKHSAMMKMMMQDIQLEIQKRLIAEGYNPENGEQMSEEEAAQQQAMIEQKKKEYTPETIENYMKTGWKPLLAKWANITNKEDRERFKIADLERKELAAFVKNGRCFREIKVGYNNYFLNHWENKDVFYDKRHKGDYPNEGQYLGRLRNLTPNQILMEFGYLLDSRQQKTIGEYFASDRFGERSTNIEKELMHPDITNRFPGYEEYKFGKEVLEKRWNIDTGMPNEYGTGLSIARTYEDGEEHTIPVMESYWVSWKKVGLYIDEEGSAHTITEEDIDKEMLQYHGIKTATNVSMAELVRRQRFGEDLGTNIIYYDWEKEIRWGVKIELNTEGEHMYLSGDPIPYAPQDFNDVPLIPVACIAREGSPIAKAAPYQANFNIMLNLINKYLKNDLGVLLITDLRAFPTDLADGSDAVNKLQSLYDTIKDTGLLPQDYSPNNTQGNGFVQQIGVQNASNMNIRNNLMQEARSFRTMAFESIGIIDQQVLGTQTSVYQSDKNIEVTKNVGYSQTDLMYEDFVDYLKRELELRLEVAKWAKQNGYDNTSIFLDSDLNRHLLNTMKDEELTLAKFRINAQDDHAKRAVVEALKAYALSENTSGMNILSRAEFVAAETMNEILAAGKLSEDREAKVRQEMQQQQMQQIEAQKQSQLEIEDAKHQNEMEIVRTKGEIDIVKQQILAEGFDKDDKNSDDIRRVAEQGLQKLNNDMIKADNENELKRLELEKKDNIEKQKIAVKQQEVDAKKYIADKNLEIARSNKNKYDKPTKK